MSDEPLAALRCSNEQKCSAVESLSLFCPYMHPPNPIPSPHLLLILLLLFIAPPSPAALASSCPIQPTTSIAIYADANGGAGPNSVEWTSRFFSWWASANAPHLLDFAFITNASSIADPLDPLSGCDLQALPLQTPF
jgi:hypothetical protein